MTEFVIAIAASVIGGLIGAHIQRVRLRRLIRAAVGDLGDGVEAVYRSQSEAAHDIERDYASTKEVRIYSMRARSIFEDSNSDLPFILQPGKSACILLADPMQKPSEAEPTPSRAIKHRVAEIAKDYSSYRDQLRHNLREISVRMTGRGNQECRMHRNFAVFRIVLFDNRLYLSSFEQGNMGRFLPVMRIAPGSLLYDGMKRFFEVEWELAAPLRLYAE